MRRKDKQYFLLLSPCAVYEQNKDLKADFIIKAGFAHYRYGRNVWLKLNNTTGFRCILALPFRRVGVAKT